MALAKLIAERGETPVFAGRAVAALASDPAVIVKTGQVLLASELAAEYGFTDVDGKIPASAEPRSSAALGIQAERRYMRSNRRGQ